MTIPRFTKSSLLAGALALTLSAPLAAQDGAGIVGKNDWLYYLYDFTDASEQPAVDRSIQLFAALSKLLAANGTQMVLAVVPAKVGIYPDNLPSERALTPFLRDHYSNSLQRLRASGVNAVDLGQPFHEAATKADHDPVFMRHDSHWSQTGALLAAQTIASHLSSDRNAEAIMASLPKRGFLLTWNPEPQTLAPGDLTTILPPGSPPFEPERFRIFTVSAEEGGDLLSNDAAPRISLVGSSYSATWTGFPDALRYALQRDVASLSVTADRGQWVGLELYLRDDGFQTQPPSLLIIEVPERSLAAPPSYPYREARYITDEHSWLRRTAASITRDCQPAGQIDAGLQAATWTVQAEGDAYLAGNLAVSGLNRMTLVWQDDKGGSHDYALEVQGDGAWHALRVPLPEAFQPVGMQLHANGDAGSVLLEDVALCRMPSISK